METYEDENNSVLLGDVPELDVNEFFESEEEENFGEEAEGTQFLIFTNYEADGLRVNFFQHFFLNFRSKRRW